MVNAAAHGQWIMRLWKAAPQTPRPLLRILATLLLATGSSVDALLIVGDALAEAGRDCVLNGDARGASGYAALAAIVRQQAALTRCRKKEHIATSDCGYQEPSMPA
jgi:hypothetical protein